MFKKELHIKPLSNLKNSESKKLQATAQKQLDVEYQLPSSVVKQTNFQCANISGSIYTDDSNKPIWFKTKFDDKLYPTIYTLWNSNIQLLPIIITHNFVIDEHILGGADLMLPGTVPPFPDNAKKGAIVGIASSKMPDVVMAVGIAQMDLYGIQHVVGTKGAAVKVVHHLEDQMFSTFKVEMKVPQVKDEAASEKDIGNQDGAKKALSLSELQLEQADETDNLAVGLAEELQSLELDDIDRFLERAAKYTIKFDDKLELPIFASAFISNHVMKNLPRVDPNQVNMKKSSWKKGTKFLKHLEDKGFLKLKGKNDSCSVISVRKDHPSLASMEAYKIGSKKVASNAASKTASKPSFKAESLYKPINKGREFVNEIDSGAFKTYYSQKEIKQLLEAYVGKKDLIDPKNKMLVLLDDLLFQMSNASPQNGGIRGISRALLMSEQFLKKNFNEYFQIYDPEGNQLYKSPLKGGVPIIKIVTETKIGRKIVTRISNFDKYRIDPVEFSQELRKKCSGSTTIGETQTSPHVVEVQVQGPHGPTAILILNNYGIPSKWINFENKLKSKKKRS